jgi:putative ABC transport system substrate-binding protein
MNRKPGQLSLTPNPSPEGRGERPAEMVGQPFPNISVVAGLRRRVRADTPCRSTRRVFLLAAAAWPVLAWAGAVFAQSKQAPVVIGWLSMGSREADEHLFAVFKDGLAALGWTEGTNFILEERWADGRTERVQALAEDLAKRKPAVIVTASGRAVRAAAKAAPRTPIVQASGGDLVVAGLAASFARPGRTVTGLTNFVTDVSEKYLELLLAAAPKLRRVGFLADPNNPNRTTLMEAARRSAARYSVEARFAEAVNADDIEPAISRLAKEGAQALVVMSSPVFSTERQRIVKLALARRWPFIAGPREFAEEGALLSYGPDLSANYRRAAYYVDRILKGAKPGDLPIEQPTRFELVINMKTAKALKLEIPRDLAVRADRVIE